MRFFKIILFNLLLYFSSLSYAHNPEDLIIIEIEQGQIIFQNEQISAEYNAAVKRLRNRRLTAMPFEKKIAIFSKAGFNHIIPKGLDHILFVLGLFFSSLKFRSLLYQVTAFTIAHSITLGLAALEIITIPVKIVEPIIALSIVWIGIENCLFNKPNKWRYLVVFTFGLLHGLGFATMLTKYGLPKDNFIYLLLSFNLGVEIGQISVLIITFMIMRFIFKQKWQSDQIRIPSSILIILIGMFWLLERLFI